MYLTHFGLRAPPFALTPDVGFLFASRGQREALEALAKAVERGEGIVKITGEVGAGKTLLCRRFLAGHAAAYIPNPCLSPRSLLRAIARELQVPVVDVNSDYDILEALNRTLLQLAAQGSSAVVCLDESQAMPRETLQALPLLSGPRGQACKAVQLVLFGRPELDRKLAGDDLAQVRACIGFHHELGALTAAETEGYLAHRLRVAGRQDGPLFCAEVARSLHRHARGVPRMVNIVAHKSLRLACDQGSAQVTPRQLRAAVKEAPQANVAGPLARAMWPRWLRVGAAW